MEQILHLFLTNKCRHNCKYCCNNLYDIEKIPVATVKLLKSVQTVCLTGGEPFGINPEYFLAFVKGLRKQYKNIENLYVYTSGHELPSHPWLLTELTKDRAEGRLLNGINVAPKDYKDWSGFVSIVNNFDYIFDKPSSNRLYVFKEQQKVFDTYCQDGCFPNGIDNINIEIIYRKWNKTFNTPDNEHFARLPILF